MLCCAIVQSAGVSYKLRSLCYSTLANLSLQSHLALPVSCAELLNLMRRADCTPACTRQVVGDRSALENDKTLTSSNIHLEETGRASLDGGVLDTKWSESPLDDGAAVLACATSTGRLALYALGVSTEANGEGCGNTGGISALSSSDAGESLLLSLDWSQGNYGDAKVLSFGFCLECNALFHPELV